MQRTPKGSAKLAADRTCGSFRSRPERAKGLLTLHRVRSLLVRQRTATVNAARVLLGEF